MSLFKTLNSVFGFQYYITLAGLSHICNISNILFDGYHIWIGVLAASEKWYWILKTQYEQALLTLRVTCLNVWCNLQYISEFSPVLSNLNFSSLVRIVKATCLLYPAYYYKERELNPFLLEGIEFPS